MSLDISLKILRFQTLAKCERAHLDGEEIAGVFETSHPLVVLEVVRISEVFANCSESEDGILRFTQSYSPLDAIATPGEPFRFALKDWRRRHKSFQWQWQHSSPAKLPHPDELGISSWRDVGRVVALEGGNFLKFSPKGAVFESERLSTLIDVCFAAIPLERLRVCPAPGCRRPYFVAHHLKQTFCGNQTCLDWGKRKLKLEYWERNKKRLLAERKQQRSKGGAHGARQTR